MPPIRLARSCILLVWLIAASTAPAGIVHGAAALAIHASAQHGFGRLPISFEVNHGQVAGRVKFLARGRDYTLFLSANEADMTLAHGMDVRLQYKGMRAHPRVVGRDKLPGKVNYIQGNDPRLWRTNISTYARVEYQGIYPGIDLAYYGRQGRVEYDWIAKPGADVSRIRVGVQGTDRIRIDRNGNLLLQAGGETLMQPAPVVYQHSGGARKLVHARYTVIGPHRFGFSVGAYDRMRPLVIDPTLIYATYLGGSNTDGGAGIAVDSKGSAFITGDTLSLDFPTAHPVNGALKSSSSCKGFLGSSHGTCVDAFVSKISPDGSTLLYSTFLGGTLDDYGYAIAVDAAGNAYVTGSTLSSNFPVINALQSRFGGGADLGDAFVTTLSPSGDRLLFSTYLGGRGDEDGQGIAVSGGSIYLTGRTNSSDFPLSHALRSKPGGGTCAYAFHAVGNVPCYDAFVTKMSVNGRTLAYSTYLGGGRTDFGWGIAVHRGRAVVTGQTTSPDFPVMRALQPSYAAGTCGGPGQQEPCNDVFVTELAPSGRALVFSTYLGGKNDDIAHGVAVDRSGTIVVVGETQSRHFPTVHALETRFKGSATMGFVSKLSAAGDKFVYSMFLGGSGIGGDVAYDVAVDTGGNAYVVGSTTSTDFPITHAFDTRLASGGNVQNGFITKINASGSALLYSSYLGGTDHDLAGSVAVDRVGNAYVTGFATSSNFPTAHPLQPALTGGTFDAIMAKIGNPHAVLPVRSVSTRHVVGNRATPRSRPATCARTSRPVSGKCKTAG